MVHSEKNSSELEKFEQYGHRGVYYWSHAVIARDWYRYAEHDNSITFDRLRICKDFLIYNRAWRGTREYRLKFSELVLDNGLLPSANMKFSQMEDIFDYHHHQFKNPAFKVSKPLEHYFEPNTAPSNASADYDQDDYRQHGVEVVLETLFDDQRWHLTEKSLRPIACGKPFILAGTPGSLEYLRSYGFKTFGDVIDESYDTVVDPVERLGEIIKLMKSIAELPADQKLDLFEKLHKIAEYNKKRFFSEDFFDTVISEYRENFSVAYQQVKSHYNETHYRQWVGQTEVDVQELAEIEAALDRIRP